MCFVEIKIVEWVSDHQPGFVRCVLRDARGCDWWITEKVPVLPGENLTSESSYPIVVSIACRIIEQSRGEGAAIATISTDPWGIESECGRSEFDVYASQLRDQSHAD